MKSSTTLGAVTLMTMAVIIFGGLACNKNNSGSSGSQSASSSPTSATVDNYTQSPSEARWLTNFEQAKDQAKKVGKVIMLDFTGSDWCGWCIKLKEEVFDKDEFKTWAGKNVILVEVDFPKGKSQDADTKRQNMELAQKYNVEGFPTILFVRPDGTELGRIGYIRGGQKAWISTADKILNPK